MTRRLTAIDLFAGCGGFSCGLMQAGFNIVAAVDNSRDALGTYYQNLGDANTKIIGEIPERSDGGWLFYENRYRKKKMQIPGVTALLCTDVTNLHGWDILDAAGVDRVDLVVGGPPCQSFSRANTHKKKGDFRDFLVFEFGRLVLEINPDTFVMENVPALVSHKLPYGRNLLDKFYQFTKNKDWEVYYSLLDEYLEWKYIAERNGKKLKDV